MKIKLCSADDWQALYINGVKVVEGHTLNADQVLRTLWFYLGPSLNMTYTVEEIDEEKLKEWNYHFPANI